MISEKKIRFLFLVFSLIIIANFPFKAWADRRHSQAEKQDALWRSLEKKIRHQVAYFSGETAVIVKDLNSGRQIAVNQDKLFPSASLAKIPIMASCFYAANEGKIRLKETLRFRAVHKTSGSGLLKNLPAGKRLSISRLTELMITQSDNTATNMLIERLGFDYLNSSFKKLGLQDTNMSRKMMDFKKRRQGIENFTSARDLAFLLEKIYRKKLINKSYSQTALNLLEKQKIKDRIPSKLPRGTVVAHKTGLERGVCHDGGIVFAKNRALLICVLTRHKEKNSRLAKKFIAHIAYLAYNIVGK